MKVAALVLAAGGSRRMGRPKQLIPYRGKPLIASAVEAVAGSGAGPVYVVLGAHFDAVSVACSGLPVRIVRNTDWNSGMGGSIRAGLTALLADAPDTGHLLIALADQPYLTPEHYASLLRRSEHFPKKIVTAEYAGKSGAPAVFPAEFFPRLLALEGDRGAREIVRSAGDDAIRAPLPEAARDWDRPTDVEAKRHT